MEFEKNLMNTKVQKRRIKKPQTYVQRKKNKRDSDKCQGCQPKYNQTREGLIVAVYKKSEKKLQEVSRF